MTHSEQVNEIAAALAKAQSEIKAAAKDRENPFFNSRYATLDAIWDACRGPLTSHGLAVVQGVSAEGEQVIVTTMLLHTSGQWIKSPLALTPKDASPQAAGSALTYGKRYGLGAMVGVTAEEDDDGQAAQPSAPAKRRAAAPRVTAPTGGGMPAQSPEATEEEAKRLFPTPEEEERVGLIETAARLANDLGLTPIDKKGYVQEFLGGASPEKADISALAAMVAALRKAVAAMKAKA